MMSSAPQSSASILAIRSPFDIRRTYSSLCQPTKSRVSRQSSTAETGLSSAPAIKALICASDLSLASASLASAQESTSWPSHRGVALWTLEPRGLSPQVQYASTPPTHTVEKPALSSFCNAFDLNPNSRGRQNLNVCVKKFARSDRAYEADAGAGCAEAIVSGVLDVMPALQRSGPMFPSTILVIDDSRTVLAIFGHLLRSRGHKVITAKDGDEGVKTAATKVPDLILCDIEMPRLDGFEVVRRLASSDATRDIPVVALTAHTSAKGLKRIESAGFAGVISKTTDPTELAPLIETFLLSSAAQPAVGAR